MFASPLSRTHTRMIVRILPNICRRTAICLSLVVISLSTVSRAHHSDDPHFFMDQNVRYEGVVTEFKFVNPHAYFYFDVTGDDGSSEAWRCELPAAVTLRRQGWTADSMAPGQPIRIDGSPARREANHCYLNAFVLADGTVVPRQDAGPVLVAEGAARQRSLRLDNGQPNISGYWATQQRSDPRERPTQTAAARAAADRFRIRVRSSGAALRERRYSSRLAVRAFRQRGQPDRRPRYDALRLYGPGANDLPGHGRASGRDGSTLSRATLSVAGKAMCSSWTPRAFRRVRSVR